MATNFAQVLWAQRMRRFGPRVGKVSWQFRIGPNFFLGLSASLRVVCKRYIAKLNGRKLRAGLLGPMACAGPGSEWAKFPGSFNRIDPNFFLGFSASLRFVCKRFIAKLNGHKLRAGLVGPSACAGSGSEWAKFPCSLESTQTFSFDSLQACESFVSVRSQN